MTKINLAPPSGTRDFLPRDLMFRRRVLAVAAQIFERHGFLPMDTPAFERLETLTGKYGDEGEKLIFKILKRGDKAASGEADMALRYDLTVPSMRAVTANRHLLPRVFKRFQIGPVWRAERAQKGRFREFYQCDVDVFGAASTLADVEVLLALSGVLEALEFPEFVIRLNSRQILKGMMTVYGVPEAVQGAAVVALDKLDKIGMEALRGELGEAGLPDPVADALHADLASPDFVERLRARLADDEEGKAGLAQVAEITTAVSPSLNHGRVEFYPLLARGMGYYTGPIFEFYAPSFGSAIAGGGRYDGLSQMFAKKAEPVCGGSLGIERIIMLLQEAAGEETALAGPTAYVTVWNADSRGAAIGLVGSLRAAGISAELDLTGGGLGQQLKLADERGCRFAVLQGPDEAAEGKISIKTLATGAQVTVPVASLVDEVAKLAV